jgi:hypothetical protein
MSAPWDDDEEAEYDEYDEEVRYVAGVWFKDAEQHARRTGRPLTCTWEDALRWARIIVPAADEAEEDPYAELRVFEHDPTAPEVFDGSP